MAKSRLSRRDLLKASTALAMTAVVAACAPAAQPTATPAPAPKATEAPKPAATEAPKPAATAAASAPTATPAAKPTEAPKPAATAAPAGKAVSIELASTTHPVEQPLNDEMADKFIKNGHSNYTIKRTYIAGNIWEKLQTLVAAGTPPDLFYQGGMQTFAFAVKGVVAPLDDWIKRDAAAMNYAEILPASLAHFNWRGKQYGLPVNAHGYPLTHNLDLYTKAGVKPPDENTTWSAFLDLGKQMSKDDGGKRVQWMSHSMSSWTNFIQIVRAEGGDLLDKDMTKCVLDSDVGIKTIQWIADLENVAKIAPKAADVAGIDAFGTGKLASIVDGFWNVGPRKVQFQWDSGFMPKGTAKRSTLNLSAGWGQAAKSKSPDETWELHKWMTGPEYQTRGAQVQLNIPNRKSIRENAEIQAIAHIKPFIAALEYSDAPPYNPRWDEMIKLVGDSLQPVWDGKAKADQAVKDMVPKVNQLIAGM